MGFIQNFINKFFKNIFKNKKDIKLGLYGPPNAGKCVTSDTEVILNNGEIKTVKDLFDYVNKKKGDYNLESLNEIFIECKDLNLIIPSFDSKELKILPKKVSFVYAQRYKGEIFRITTSSGRKIKVTPEHPLVRLSNKGVNYVKSKSLNIGDSISIAKKLCLSSSLDLNPISITHFNLNGSMIQSKSKFHNPKEISIPSYINEDLAGFVGYTIAESYHTNNRIKFSNSDATLLNDFTKLSNNLFSLDPIKRINKGVPELELNSKTLTDYLEKNLDFKPSTSLSKTIPKKFLGLPDNIISKLLQVLYDCEGYVSKEGKTRGGEIEISSKSKKLIEQIQILLNRFEIVGNFRKKIVKDNPYYILSIRGSKNHRIFRDKIGFSISKKAERLDALCSLNPKRNTFFLPITSFLEDLRIKRGLTQKEFFLDDKHVARMLRKGKITQERLEKMSQHLNINFIKKLVKSDVEWDQIRDIEKIYYDDYVYDLTIEDTHTFIISNGLIAHNTTLANKICQDWLGEDMGKVSNIAHETREIKIKEQISIKSKDGNNELSFNLVDTPGIATKIDYEDFIKSGMKSNAAKKRAKEATKGVVDAIKWLDDMDAVAVVLDSTQDPYSQVNITIIGNLAARNIPVLIVGNKSDLKKADLKKVQAAFPQYKVVGISAKYGKNVKDFYNTLFEVVG